MLAEELLGCQLVVTHSQDFGGADNRNNALGPESGRVQRQRRQLHIVSGEDEPAVLGEADLQQTVGELRVRRVVAPVRLGHGVKPGCQLLGVDADQTVGRVAQSLQDALTDPASHARDEYVSHRWVLVASHGLGVEAGTGACALGRRHIENNDPAKSGYSSPILYRPSSCDSPRTPLLINSSIWKSASSLSSSPP